MKKFSSSAVLLLCATTLVTQNSTANAMMLKADVESESQFGFSSLKNSIAKSANDAKKKASDAATKAAADAKA